MLPQGGGKEKQPAKAKKNPFKSFFLALFPLYFQKLTSESLRSKKWILIKILVKNFSILILLSLHRTRVGLARLLLKVKRKKSQNGKLSIEAESGYTATISKHNSVKIF